ncbi:hypothetical protein SNEBB_005042 [Seison nebaliae]|nr:hypothetical protein SNEBB_005042 [Seison nebaliae]
MKDRIIYDIRINSLTQVPFLSGKFQIKARLTHGTSRQVQYSEVKSIKDYKVTWNGNCSFKFMIQLKMKNNRSNSTKNDKNEKMNRITKDDSLEEELNYNNDSSSKTKTGIDDNLTINDEINDHNLNSINNNNNNNNNDEGNDGDVDDDEDDKEIENVNKNENVFDEQKGNEDVKLRKTQKKNPLAHQSISFEREYVGNISKMFHGKESNSINEGLSTCVKNVHSFGIMDLQETDEKQVQSSASSANLDSTSSTSVRYWNDDVGNDSNFTNNNDLTNNAETLEEMKKLLEKYFCRLSIRKVETNQKDEKLGFVDIRLSHFLPKQSESFDKNVVLIDQYKIRSGNVRMTNILIHYAIKSSYFPNPSTTSSCQTKRLYEKNENGSLWNCGSTSSTNPRFINIQRIKRPIIFGNNSYLINTTKSATHLDTRKDKDTSTICAVRHSIDGNDIDR